VQQRRHPNCQAVFFGGWTCLPLIAEQRERTAGEMICAEGVLEAGVSGTGIHQERMAKLADVAETLNGWSIEGE
jgi:hypothetical protein